LLLQSLEKIMKNKELDKILDQIASEIHSEQVDGPGGK